MKEITGYPLWEKLFGEELEFEELDDMGVSEIKTESRGVDGWWEKIEHTFYYLGRMYSIIEKSHVSPNVGDSDFLWETFHEVEENIEKTVILQILRASGDGRLPFSKLHEPQTIYENMVRDDKTISIVKVDDLEFVIKILEFEGVVPPLFMNFVTATLLNDVQGTQKLFKVQAIN